MSARFAGGRVPPRPVRVAQRVAMKLGRTGGWAVPGAGGPTRVLVRVDEFPHYRADDDPGRYGTAGFERFHAILCDAGVPYLIGGLPRVAERPLDPAHDVSRALTAEESAVLARITGEGVTVALHGYDHRTRDADPRRHSELAGLPNAELDARLQRGEDALVAAGVPRPRIFVPPYNRFDRAQWPVLARRYAVVGGGPESVLEHGRWRTPALRDGTVWLPAYAPLYGRAAEVLPALDDLPGGFVPFVLHWGWEADAGWADLERLATRLSGLAAPWDELLEAIPA